MKIMKCGHTPNATTIDGKPICAICYGITPNAEILEEKEIDLSQRKARCWCCGKVTTSNERLPFFELRLNAPYDSYYCGCDGWD